MFARIVAGFAIIAAGTALWCAPVHAQENKAAGAPAERAEQFVSIDFNNVDMRINAGFSNFLKTFKYLSIHRINI